MATIKGQNLRIAITPTGGTKKYIALATSCTAHIAAEVQDKSTKDTENGYADNEVVGLNWDVQTESLVCQAEGEEGSVTCSNVFPNDDDVFTGDKTFDLAAGDTLAVESTENVVLVFGDGDSYATVGTDYTYTATGRTKITIASAVQDTSVDYTYTDASAVSFESLADMITNKERVLIRFEQTNGYKNRGNVQTILSGYALLTDLSVNAPNRQDSTATATFTGDGEITIT